MNGRNLRGRGSAAFREGERRGKSTEARIARSLGAPALFAIAASAVGSSILFALGVVAADALAYTPLVFLAAAMFFVLTTITYIEGSSLHPERGGAFVFARYAFNELWSFVAGWAILLDYLIVMAIAAFITPHYLAVFWGGADDGLPQIALSGGVIAFVAWLNFRGLSADRYRFVLRLSLVSFVLFGVIVVVGLAQLLDLSLLTDAGPAPGWEELVIAAVIATVACTGIEAASGLAGELRVGREGLRRVVVAAAVGVLVVFVGVSFVALMAVPVEGGSTALGSAFVNAPVLGVVAALEPDWLAEALRYAVGAVGGLVLIQAANGQMLGIGRLAYSLGTNRQIPSLLSRLDDQRSTPYVTIFLAAGIAFALSLTSDLEFLAGIFAFGAMLAFTIAHLSVIVMRFREPDRPRAFTVGPSVSVGGGSIPIPSALGAILSALALVTVIAFHEGARVVGGIWMAFGLALYVIYRTVQDKPLTKRFTIPAEALREARETEYGSILVPIFGVSLDDDIVGTAGRLASEETDDEGEHTQLEVIFPIEVPMSLPIDARVPPEKLAAARTALARAKKVGEEYGGVEVKTASIRGRTAGSVIVTEAKRRGVEVIVLAAEAPSRIRGGAILGGLGASRDRIAGDVTRYVIEKATCKVILTAPPAETEPETLPDAASAPG